MKKNKKPDNPVAHYRRQIARRAKMHVPYKPAKQHGQTQRNGTVTLVMLLTLSKESS